MRKFEPVNCSWLNCASLFLVVIACITITGKAYGKIEPDSNWVDFVYPEVVVDDKDDGTTTGSQLVQQLIPDLPAFLQEIALGVCKTLYKSADEVPNFEQLTFELEYRDGVAYKSGSSPRITINMSTQYLESQYESMGNAAITYEIAGVTWHELTHAYQHSPRNAGGYTSGTEHFGFVEGVADAVRIMAGYHKTRSPYQGGSWTDGYTTTGFFIEWVQDTYYPDFLYELNQSCLTIDPWSYQEACTEIIGKGVDVLWDEYQDYIPVRDDMPRALFDADATIISTGQTVSFSDRSYGGPQSYEWSFEGGDPLTSTEAGREVTYDEAGTYDVSLRVTNETGTTIRKIDSYITVIDTQSLISVITEPGGQIEHQHTETPPNEGVDMLLDGNITSKYCVLQKDTWIQYEFTEPQKIYGYALTAGNDEPGRDPYAWTLEASNNEVDWQEIDVRDRQQFVKRYQTNEYMLEQDFAFQYYRWNLTSKIDSSFQISELALYSMEESETVAGEFNAGDKKNNKKTGLTLRAGGRIEYAMPEPQYSRARISIVNMRGAQVLQKRLDIRGARTVVFDCRKPDGTMPASGTYVAVISLAGKNGNRVEERCMFNLIGN